MDLISEFLGGHRYFCHWHSGKTLYGNQIKVHNKKEVIKLIEKYNGSENCGISISTFINGMPKLLYLPFDFDSTNLREAFEDAKRLYNTMVGFGYKASFHFSGGKGFHVLIPIVPKHYSKIQLLKAQQFFKRILKLETADEQIFRDIRRIIRIPGTYHMNGNLCDIYMKNDNGNVLDIENLSPPDFSKFKNLGHSINNSSMNNRIYHDYPCVERLINDEDYWHEHHPRGSFEPHWLIRFAWIIEQSYKGRTADEMIEDIEDFRWDDYDKDKTLYNIKYILERGYTHPNCDTLKEMNLCLDKCPYNKEWKARSINDKRQTLS